MMTAAVLVALGPLMVLTAFFSIEVGVGLVPLRNRRDHTGSAPSAVIAIPAHDEALVIEKTLSQLKGALGPKMRILVIADNCSDTTAELARAAQVQLIERRDPDRRGKGYALAFAVEHLANEPPDVLVIIDADCAIDRQSLDALVGRAAACGRPCQAVNLLRPDLKAAALVQISGFAFMLKNLIRQRGLQRLAGRVHLTGTGMAIPFSLLSSSLLATGDVVEDLSLGLEMSRRGYPAELVSDAMVVSCPSDTAGTLTQRRRWEGGFIASSFNRVPRTMLQAIRARDLRSFLGALDLLVPPLALLALLNLAFLVAMSIVTVSFGVSWAPVVLDCLLLLTATVLVFAAWATNGRDFVSLRVLARVPLYIGWKLPLYWSLARRGPPSEWLRTGR